MSNLLDLVPSLDRQLRVYKRAQDTDSKLAGYLADSVEALSYFWPGKYALEFIAPSTYIVTPDIEIQNKRPLVLMASIIYKQGTLNTAASIRDGDFSYDPFSRNNASTLKVDLDELKLFLPKYSFAPAISGSLNGFNNIWNSESYNWMEVLGLLGINI